MKLAFSEMNFLFSINTPFLAQIGTGMVYVCGRECGGGG